MVAIDPMAPVAVITIFGSCINSIFVDGVIDNCVDVVDGGGGGGNDGVVDDIVTRFVLFINDVDDFFVINDDDDNFDDNGVGGCDELADEFCDKPTRLCFLQNFAV